MELLGSCDEHPDARPERGMTLFREQVPPGEIRPLTVKKRMVRKMEAARISQLEGM